MLANDGNARAGRGARGEALASLWTRGFVELPVAAAVIDPLGVVLARNPAFEELERNTLGGALEGRSLLRALEGLGPCGERGAAALRALLAGEQGRLELTLAPGAGHGRLCLHATPCSDGAAGATVVLTPAGEPGIDEQAQRRHSVLLRNAFDVVLLMEPTGFVLYRSPGRDEIIGRNSFDEIHPEDQPHARAAMRRILENPTETAHVELRLTDAEGRWRWSEGIAANLLDDPDVRAIVVNLRDITERKEAEAALQRSAEQHRAVFEQASDPMFLLSPESRILDANPSAARFLGYEREALRAREIFELVADDDAREARRMAPTLRAGESVRVDRAFRRGDGGLVPVDVRVDVLADGRRLVVLRDQSARMAELEIERRVREEREGLLERLLLTLDGIPFGCVVSDASLRITYLNPAAERLFGFSLVEVGGRLPHEAFSSADAREALRRLFDPLAEGESIAHGAISNEAKDGRRLTCDWHNTALRRSDGTLVGVLSICEDITERRRAEEALFESQRALATLISNLPGVAYRARVDERGLALEFVSGRVVDLTGYRAEQFLREPRLLFTSLVEPGDRERVERTLREALERREPFELQYRIRTESGEERWVWDQGSGVYSSSGEPVALEGYFSDVTEQRRLEEALRQSQKLEAIGRLAGGIAHDFNNLLTVILSSTSLALEGVPEGSAARGEMDLVLDAAQRAGAMTHQLLAFARKQIVEPRTIDLGGLLRGLDGILRRLLGEDVEVRAALADPSWPVKVDPGQMEQVIVNLVVNARAAMPSGGTLTLEVQNVTLAEADVKDRVDVEPGDYAKLTVRDTGVGMGGETLTHIFEPFYTTKEPGRGTGLGLASAYGIVRQAGGHIRVESEPGRGSAFHILLPRCRDEDAGNTSAPAGPAEARGGETVLLVEDAPFVMRVATLSLQRKGYRVITATTGAEALEVAGRHEGAIDVLVTDVVMPGMSGTELAKQLRAARPGVRVLYVSGYTEDDVVHRGVVEEEGVAFLPKPFTPEGLGQKVRALLDASVSAGTE